MTSEIEGLLPLALLISLDHDLDAEEGSNDEPGSGWNAAQHLAALQPVCPVIVHTSNTVDGYRMCELLQVNGWECHRLFPIGDDWIENDWLPLVRRLLKRRRPKA
jgi:hypothetical protein